MKHRKPIGLVIKDLIDSKKMSVKDIADKKGVTRQTIYQDFKLESMTLVKLEMYAEALGVTTEVLISMQNQEDQYIELEKSEQVQDVSVWRNLVDNYEKRIDELLYTISIQKKLIELGKFNPAPYRPNAKVILFTPKFEQIKVV